MCDIQDFYKLFILKLIVPVPLFICICAAVEEELTIKGLCCVSCLISDGSDFCIALEFCPAAYPFLYCLLISSSVYPFLCPSKYPSLYFALRCRSSSL